MNNEKIKPTYDEVYSAYIIASQERYKYKNVIDKIKEDLIKTKKYNTRCQDTYGNELIKVDIDHINYLLELLEEVDE
jgi:hypothetical protein